MNAEIWMSKKDKNMKMKKKAQGGELRVSVRLFQAVVGEIGVDFEPGWQRKSKAQTKWNVDGS